MAPDTLPTCNDQPDTFVMRPVDASARCSCLISQENNLANQYSATITSAASRQGNQTNQNCSTGILLFN